MNALRATVRKLIGAIREIVGVAGFSAAQADYTSLVIDGGGTPYVAYEDFPEGEILAIYYYYEPPVG